jgi:hypothetical protein
MTFFAHKNLWILRSSPSVSGSSIFSSWIRWKMGMPGMVSILGAAKLGG